MKKVLDICDVDEVSDEVCPRLIKTDGQTRQKVLGRDQEGFFNRLLDTALVPEWQ